MASTENIPTAAARGRMGTTATLTAKTSGFTIAITTPFASSGSPLDFSSNHTCARVADDVGHGNRNRLTNVSGNPAPEKAVVAASPRRCRATPTTDIANAATAIAVISA